MSKLFARLVDIGVTPDMPLDLAAALRATNCAALLISDTKGMRYLALLLAHPGERLPVASLLTSAAGPTATVSTSPERARPAVTKRIRDAITRLGTHNAALGYHLATAIKTGNHCVYLPDPQRRIQWGA